jgi:hypothetical protein
MRADVIGCAIVALAALAMGQPAHQPSKAFPLLHAKTSEDLKQVQEAVSSWGALRQVQFDTENTAIVVGGTTEQIRFADWLIGKIDGPTSAPSNADPAGNSYRMRDFLAETSVGDMVRVFYLTHLEMRLDLLEAQTMVRMTGDAQYVSLIDSRRILVVRGTAPQLEWVAWLLDELDRPIVGGTTPLPTLREHGIPGGDERVCLFFLPGDSTPRELNAAMLNVGSATQSRRLFYHTSQRVLAVRGTADQIAIAKRVISEGH